MPALRRARRRRVARHVRVGRARDDRRRRARPPHARPARWHRPRWRRRWAERPVPTSRSADEVRDMTVWPRSPCRSPSGWSTQLHPWTSFVDRPALRARQRRRRAHGATRSTPPGPHAVAAAWPSASSSASWSAIAGAHGWGCAAGSRRLPDGVAWRQLVGVAAVAGIGFTVSLFVAGLAYEDPACGRGPPGDPRGVRRRRRARLGHPGGVGGGYVPWPRAVDRARGLIHSAWPTRGGDRGRCGYGCATPGDGPDGAGCDRMRASCAPAAPIRPSRSVRCPISSQP